MRLRGCRLAFIGHSYPMTQYAPQPLCDILFWEPSGLFCRGGQARKTHIKMTMEDTGLIKEEVKALAHDKEQWSQLCSHLQQHFSRMHFLYVHEMYVWSRIVSFFRSTPQKLNGMSGHSCAFFSLQMPRGERKSSLSATIIQFVFTVILSLITKIALGKVHYIPACRGIFLILYTELKYLILPSTSVNIECSHN